MAFGASNGTAKTGAVYAAGRAAGATANYNEGLAAGQTRPTHGSSRATGRGSWVLPGDCGLHTHPGRRTQTSFSFQRITNAT